MSSSGVPKSLFERRVCLAGKCRGFRQEGFRFYLKMRKISSGKGPLLVKIVDERRRGKARTNFTITREQRLSHNHLCENASNRPHINTRRVMS